MTCKDCIHYDICHNNFKNIDLNEEMTDEHCCVYFKDKSRIVELPDTVYVQGVIGTMNLSKAEAVCRDLINLGTVAGMAFEERNNEK